MSGEFLSLRNSRNWDFEIKQISRLKQDLDKSKRGEWAPLGFSEAQEVGHAWEEESGDGVGGFAKKSG
jgi:hypothetical protein